MANHTSSHEPFSARLSDCPPPPGKPAWGKVVFIIIILLVVFSPHLLFTGCLFIGWQTQSTIDRLHGPLRLESTVRLPSPDQKIRFEADTDGTVRLIHIATGRVLHKQHLSVQDYRGIDALWQDSQ